VLEALLGFILQGTIWSFTIGRFLLCHIFNVLPQSGLAITLKYSEADISYRQADSKVGLAVAGPHTTSQRVVVDPSQAG
jgi:hypothetical protein